MGVCLQLLEPVLVHNMLRLPPQKQINPDLCACVNAQDINGNSALHFAVKNQNAQLVQALIYKKININTHNVENMTAITLAAYHGNGDILEMLITAGADINHQDMYGNTPFHYGCKFNHKEIVQILLKQTNLLFKRNSEQIYPDYIQRMRKYCQFLLNFRKNIRRNINKYKFKTLKMTLFLKQILEIDQRFSITSNIETYSKKYKSSNSIQNQFNTTTTFSTNNSESIKKIEEAVKPEQFEVVGLIEKGSFGQIYLVSKQKQLYAMKVLHKSLIINNNLCRYAQTERNVLSITSHPIIVKLSYAFQTNDKLFMKLDFCPGGDLGQVLRQVRRLPDIIQRNKINIIIQLKFQRILIITQQLIFKQQRFLFTLHIFILTSNIIYN